MTDNVSLLIYSVFPFSLSFHLVPEHLLLELDLEVRLVISRLLDKPRIKAQEIELSYTIFHSDPFLTARPFQWTEPSSLPINTKIWFKSRLCHLLFCFMVSIMKVMVSSVWFTMFKSRLQIRIELSWFLKPETLWNQLLASHASDCSSPTASFLGKGVVASQALLWTWTSWAGLGVCISNKCPSDVDVAGLTSEQDFRCFWHISMQILKRSLI